MSIGDPSKSHYGGSGALYKKQSYYKPLHDCLQLILYLAFRDREDHLKVFLHHMHPILQRQQLDYRIVIVEQTKDDDFNRAGNKIFVTYFHSYWWFFLSKT